MEWGGGGGGVEEEEEEKLRRRRRAEGDVKQSSTLQTTSRHQRKLRQTCTLSPRTATHSKGRGEWEKHVLISTIRLLHLSETFNPRDRSALVPLMDELR